MQCSGDILRIRPRIGLGLIAAAAARRPALDSSALHYTEMHYTEMHCTVLCCTVISALDCTSLHCTILHLTASYCSVLIVGFSIIEGSTGCTRSADSASY